MKPPSEEHLARMLGKSVEDEPLRRFLLRHGGPHQGELVDPGLPEYQYFTAEESAVEVLANEDGVVQAVFIHLNGHEGKDRYDGPLPEGLSPEMSQQDVRHILGEPQFRRLASRLEVVPPLNRADRYDYELYSLHLEYSASGKLHLVTLMTPSNLPEAEGEGKPMNGSGRC